MMKTAKQRRIFAALAWVLGYWAGVAQGEEVKYEVRNGVRYQVTRRTEQRQVPTTVLQNRQQTVYTQQLTTNTINHQQLYCVPSTSYQWDSRLNGRWNPFVTPYWTYNLRPVTTWSTQVANVQIPVNRVAWVPQTQTKQVPVTAYRTEEVETITRVAMDNLSPSSSTQLATSRAATLRPHTPIAIATRPGRPISSNSLGSVGKLDNDPPRQGWQSPNTSGFQTGNRY